MMTCFIILVFYYPILTSELGACYLGKHAAYPILSACVCVCEKVVGIHSLSFIITLLTGRVKLKSTATAARIIGKEHPMNTVKHASNEVPGKGDFASL